MLDGSWSAAAASTVGRTSRSTSLALPQVRRQNFPICILCTGSRALLSRELLAGTSGCPSFDNAELLLHQTPLWRTGSPTRDAQNKRNQEYESEQEGERGKETSKHQSQRDREQRYVELLSQQEQEEARARISQVRLFGSCRF